jgi:hypothetical protein
MHANKNSTISHSKNPDGSKRYTELNKERGKTSWEQPPPPPLKLQCIKIKNDKEQKAVAKQPCPSLQEDLTTVQVCAL